jgi:hypothetical protein
MTNQCPNTIIPYSAARAARQRGKALGSASCDVGITIIIKLQSGDKVSKISAPGKNVGMPLTLNGLALMIG